MRGGRFGRQDVGIDHEEHVREGAAEKGAVNGTVTATLGRVDVLASWTEELDGLLERIVAETDGKQRLLIAEHARATAKVGALVLFEHLGQAASGDDVACMYEAVEQLCLRFDRVANRFREIAFQRVGDEIKRMWVVLHFSIETCEVEAVEDVVFVDLAKVLVALCREEPGDPRVGCVVAARFGEIVHHLSRYSLQAVSMLLRVCSRMIEAERCVRARE